MHAYMCTLILFCLHACICAHEAMLKNCFSEGEVETFPEHARVASWCQRDAKVIAGFSFISSIASRDCPLT